jgi:hypothetical protein
MLDGTAGGCHDAGHARRARVKVTLRLTFMAATLCAGFLACGATAAEPALAPVPGAGKLVASKESGWPQWRGIRRDGVSGEKGLLPSWPEGGPKLLWTVPDLGRGWSSPIIHDGTFYITGDVGEDLVIFAFDLDGKPKWQAKNGRAWKNSWPGARACCLYDEGRLYHMNAHGRTVCLDVKTGQELWAVETLKVFEGQEITWGISECLLADGPRLIVSPGGKKAMMAALDKKTGQTVWASDPIPGDKAGYASPILFEWGGRRHLVSCSSRHAYGVDADTGRLLWKVPQPTRYEVIAATPLFHDGAVFVTVPDGNGGVLLRLKAQEKGVGVETAWTSPLDNCDGGCVLVNGVIYSSGYTTIKWWAGVEWATGRMLQEKRDLGQGSSIWADGRLYVLAETGAMALLKPAEAGFEVAGRFDLVAGKRDAWAHPVILDGRLYLRFHDKLYCYDVRAK